MSIPSGFHLRFLSCKNGINLFVDADSVPGCNPFLSTQPLGDPPSYNTDNAQTSNLVNSCSSRTPIDHDDLLNHPSLMGTICNSSLLTHRRSWDNLRRATLGEKRWNHKTIEKQRRKDMKTLFSRMRSLLPEENLRGKRAESEQVLGAVDYICHLQHKIEDLSKERERMKANIDRKEQVSFVGEQISANEKFCNKHPGLQGSEGELPTVKINSVHSSVKISLNAFEDQIVYSDLLMALEECGLEVVNAASSSINSTVFYTIHNKVSDRDHYNMEALYEKLRHLISDNHADERDLEARDECLFLHKLLKYIFNCASVSAGLHQSSDRKQSSRQRKTVFKTRMVSSHHPRERRFQKQNEPMQLKLDACAGRFLKLVGKVSPSACKSLDRDASRYRPAQLDEQRTTCNK